MTKVISQSKAIAQATAITNAQADGIVTAAIGADKAKGKLSDHIRALFASPLPVVAATLSQSFVTLADKLTKKGTTDSEAWARIANSIATNVRTIVAGLADEVRPELCYIALDRANHTANVQVLGKASLQDLKNTIGHDLQAFNKAKERLFGNRSNEKPNPKQAPAAKVVVGQPDKGQPQADAVAALLEQCRGLSIADLDRLQKAIAAEIDAKTAANLEKAEKAGKGATAKGKTNAKSRGESQKVAQRIGNAKNSPQTDVQPTETEAGAHGTTVELDSVA